MQVKKPNLSYEYFNHKMESLVWKKSDTIEYYMYIINKFISRKMWFTHYLW